MLTSESQAKLDERVGIGTALIKSAWCGRVERGDEDFTTAAKDAISNILTALFGPAGHWIYDEGNPVSGVSLVTDADAYADASSLVDDALQSYFGDAEDYHNVLAQKPEPGQYGYVESHEDRVVELEAKLDEIRTFISKVID